VSRNKLQGDPGSKGGKKNEPSRSGGWDLVEWLERCARIPMTTSKNPKQWQ
jgi:hypothetical protein